MADVDGCGISAIVLDMQEKTYFITYYVIMPCYFFIGMFGNVALLIAFYKQAKTESAYAYQVLLTVSKTLEIFTFSLFMLGFKWGSGIERPGTAWYMRNYFLMFYAAHIGCALVNVFIISSLLMSVAMTADRVFALSKPFVYKNINHKKHQVVAGSVCFGIGLFTNIYDGWRWHVLENRNLNGTMDGYVAKADEEFLSTNFAIGLGHLRTGVRLGAVVSLIVLNVAMAIIFRRRTKRVAQMSQNDQKEQSRKSAERTLLILTIYQSALTSLAQVPHSGYYIATFVSTNFTRCWGIVVAPFVDGCIQVSDAADFFVIIAINRKMRRMVARVLPFPCLKSENMVTTIANKTVTVGAASEK